MKLLLTSSGVTNASIRAALVDLLGKPVEEASALVVPTAIQPFPFGPELVAKLVRAEVGASLTGIGWGSLGLLELSALPSIAQDVWRPGVEAADALLFWGGDPLHLSFWLERSGLGALLPSLPGVYVGVSAGAIAAASTFAETYTEPRGGSGEALSSQEVLFSSPDGDVPRTVVTARGAGLVDVAVIPHLENPNHPDASLPNAERWAAHLPVPTYGLDDQSALTVVDGQVEVVSEGTWRRFEPVR